MPGSGRNIHIAGAGIAGLTLALALAKFGASVTVIERNSQIQEFGAGLQLSPNARRVLNQLGLDRAIASASFEPEGIDVYPFGRRTPLVTLALGAAARQRYGTPYAVMQRADLAQLLYKACRRFANIDIVFNATRFEIEPQPQGVAVTVATEDGPLRRGRGFAFVGADGVNSVTRREVLGGPAAKQSGRIAFRAMVAPDALEGVLAADRTSLLLAGNAHGVVYPLPHRHGVNVVIFARSASKAGPRLPRSLRRSRQFARLLDAVGDGWTHWPVATVTAPAWHKGNVGLIGDAAHAMLPFQAQGAAMAIEDAAILAPLLITEPTAQSAFARYEAMRRARVQRVARLSASNGQAFHMGFPLNIGRNMVIGMQGPMGHFQRLDWLYSYDTSPELVIEGPTRPF